MNELFVDHNSDFLFARPSFVGGIARILDLGGTMKIYNNSPTGEIADMIALGSDWRAVANELIDSITQHETSHGK